MLQIESCCFSCTVRKVFLLISIYMLCLSSGVGRTGAFCLLYAALQELEAGNGIPDLPLLVKKMRQQRKNMLQEKVRCMRKYKSCLWGSKVLSGSVQSCTEGRKWQMLTLLRQYHPDIMSLWSLANYQRFYIFLLGLWLLKLTDYAHSHILTWEKHLCHCLL